MDHEEAAEVLVENRARLVWAKEKKSMGGRCSAAGADTDFPGS
jgi:hypothetical protein